MTYLLIKTEATPLTVDLSSLIPQNPLTTEQFYTFCQHNQDLRIERTAAGEIIVMPPAFSDTGNRNFKIALQLGLWAEQDGTGEGFDSSAGFTLPNGATRSPDAAWIRSERWHALTPEQQTSFAPICPDFVIELCSASDSLTSLKEKLQECIDNGTQLGLLIDRKERCVHVYQPGRSPNILSNPDQVSCAPELPGFTFRMANLW